MSVRHWLKNSRLRGTTKYRSPALEHCPHKTAVVIKSMEATPRKPNSAERRIAKVRLSNRRYVRVYFEGIGLNRLPPHSQVLVRGSGPRDLPGVRYHTVRGKLDLAPLLNYRRARSKYGVKKPKDEKDKAKKISLSEIRHVQRAKIKINRRRFLNYQHLAMLKYKASRRRFWLLKARLP